MQSAASAFGPFVLFELGPGAAAFEVLSALVDLVDPWCYSADPISVLEAMAEPGGTIKASPIIFGYVNYAMPGYRSESIAFADLPVMNATGVQGSVLGGTGVAVSASSGSPSKAQDFAKWLAGRDSQAGPYVGASGQPAHVAAWTSERANVASNHFFQRTRQTLEGAWVRPRHAGFIDFQSRAAEYINSALRGKQHGDTVIAQLNQMFRQSFVDGQPPTAPPNGIRPVPPAGEVARA